MSPDAKQQASHKSDLFFRHESTDRVAGASVQRLMRDPSGRLRPCDTEDRLTKTCDQRDFISDFIKRSTDHRCGGSLTLRTGVARGAGTQIQRTRLLKRNGWVHNSERLAVLNDTGVITAGDVASAMEARFTHDG